jgi:GrpB-like predicted nucleotidyltransferase (UPF0157 family)
MRVVVSPYDPAWPTAFETVRTGLERALQGVAVRSVEHVGSTSVPGLAAKPIVDVDVVVPRGEVERAIDALVGAGYSYAGDLGIPDRHAFRAPDDGIRRNVYVCVEGCLALRNHLAVRDLLREDAELREEYGATKLALSQREFDNIDGYLAGKNEVLRKILARAGLSDAERADIAAVNPR